MPYKDPAKRKASRRRYQKTPKGRSAQRKYRQSAKGKARAARDYAAHRPARLENTKKNWRRRNGVPEPTRPAPGRCELCGNPPPGRQGLHADHDHATGMFRGWLCLLCNHLLGRLGDQIALVNEWHTRITAYLQRVDDAWFDT